MTIKEKFLAIETYEEFDRRRAEFRDLKLADADDDIWEHMAKIFPKVGPVNREVHEDYFIKKQK